MKLQDTSRLADAVWKKLGLSDSARGSSDLHGFLLSQTAKHKYGKLYGTSFLEPVQWYFGMTVMPRFSIMPDGH